MLSLLKIRERAESVFKDLNDAYSIQDLEKISKILNSLKNGGFETNSEKIDDSKILKAKIDELREKLETLNIIIEKLKNSETYKQIGTLENWDDYFFEIENKYLSLKKSA